MRRPGAPAIAVQAILQAIRRAPSCDVQEQQNSGVQPELREHELTRSRVTATVGQGRAAPAIAVQAILQALRTAQSCDVQEQHTSGVQPEQAENELTCSW